MSFCRISERGMRGSPNSSAILFENIEPRIGSPPACGREELKSTSHAGLAPGWQTVEPGLPGAGGLSGRQALDSGRFWSRPSCGGLSGHHTPSASQVAPASLWRSLRSPRALSQKATSHAPRTVLPAPGLFSSCQFCSQLPLQMAHPIPSAGSRTSPQSLQLSQPARGVWVVLILRIKTSMPAAPN